MDDTLYDSYGGIYTVASVGGSGDILTLRIVQPGITASPPSNPVSMTNSSIVSGSGATFNLTWSAKNTLALNPSGGKVSIGTTSPETTLHITSTGTGTTLGQLNTNLRLQTNTGTVGAGSEISFRGSVNATDPNTLLGSTSWRIRSLRSPKNS